ncbi:unnamed protein product, partial [Penicillium salamii]
MSAFSSAVTYSLSPSRNVGVWVARGVVFLAHLDSFQKSSIDLVAASTRSLCASLATFALWRPSSWRSCRNSSWSSSLPVSFA